MPRTRGDGFERAVKLTHALFAGEALTARTVVERWGVCYDTAVRDLRDLQVLLPTVVERVRPPGRRGKGVKVLRLVRA